jgi:MoaA/NifB/PqqE/SkfB family radical SAM enzyme
MNNGDYRACCWSEPGLPSDVYPDEAANFYKEPIEKVWNNSFFTNLRTDLATGVQNKTCNTCWKQEEAGEFSYRQKFDLDLKNEEKEKIINETLTTNGILSNTPKTIQIKIGNLCNLKCITCNQAASSLHEKEVLEWKKNNIKLPSFLEWINSYEIDWDGINENTNLEIVYKNYKHGLENADLLQLIGGEPLVNPITNYIIERIIEDGYAHQLELYIISNLTTLNDKVLKHFSKFKQTIVSISWDHVESNKFNYIRFPATYKHFRTNVERLLNKPNILPKISTTFSIFNIFDLEEIFDEFEKVSQQVSVHFDVNFVIVDEPNYFSIRYLEKEQKQKIMEIVKSYVLKNKDYKIFKENPYLLEIFNRFDNILNHDVEDFDAVVIERTRVLQMYDNVRKINYRELFPYIKEYYNHV